MVEQLLAAGASVDVLNTVGGQGAQIVEGWMSEHTLRVLLFFWFCASENFGLSSLLGLVRVLFTLLRRQRGNVTDSPSNHLKEI